MKKIELEVWINCCKCKTEVMRAVGELRGIDQISIDGEKKTLTVVGEVDPVLIAKKIRRIRKGGKIISVGPQKPPATPNPPKLPNPASKPNPPPEPHFHPCCSDCQLAAISFAPYDGPMCSIL